MDLPAFNNTETVTRAYNCLASSITSLQKLAEASRGRGTAGKILIMPEDKRLK